MISFPGLQGTACAGVGVGLFLCLLLAQHSWMLSGLLFRVAVVVSQLPQAGECLRVPCSPIQGEPCGSTCAFYGSHKPPTSLTLQSPNLGYLSTQGSQPGSIQDTLLPLWEL